MTIQERTAALLADYRDGRISRGDLDEMNFNCDGLSRQESAALARVLQIVEAEEGGVKEVAVEAIKRGEFVRRAADSKKTYRRGAYDPSTRRYSLEDYGDASREVFVKKGTKLFVGFSF